MNYKETLEYIHSIPKFNRILGNALLEKLLNKMGNPQDNLKFIHIGGTNGKGSTCTMVSQILTEAGYKTGLFTSPFLKFFNERIKINGVPISNSDLADIASYVKKITEKYDAFVSEFAFDTAVAFEYFNRQNCDFVILEVGLGGKLDATNIIKNPLVVGFTAIGLDHCQYLGNTIDEISKEKASNTTSFTLSSVFCESQRETGRDEANSHVLVLASNPHAIPFFSGWLYINTFVLFGKSTVALYK